MDALGISARRPSSASVRWLGACGDSNLQHVFDDVRGAVEAVNLGDGGLNFAGGEPIRFVLEDGSHRGMKAFRIDLARIHDHTCSVRFDARRDARLVIAQRNANQRHTFRQRLEDRIEPGVRDNRRCPFDEIQLRSVVHDDRVAAQGS